MPPLNVIFMGTAELACPSLNALAQSSAFRVSAVVTQPDRPKGRDLKLSPSPVKELALRLNLPILQPTRARDEAFVQALQALQPDLIVVAAFGQILPQSILDSPVYGCLNVHTSLLPNYRGAAPIQWAILNGDPETGVTIMKMDAGLDTGDILTQQSTPIESQDNSQTLHDRLATIGAELLLQTIPAVVAGTIVSQPQVGPSTYARKITKADGALDWSQPALVLWNRIRGLTPWPGAFTYQPATPKPRLWKIWQAEVTTEFSPGEPGEILRADRSGIVVACGQNALRIQSLQREGGRRLSAQEFLAGTEIVPGQKLTATL